MPEKCLSLSEEILIVINKSHTDAIFLFGLSYAYVPC